MIAHLVSTAYGHTPQTHTPTSFISLSDLRAFISSLTFALPHFEPTSQGTTPEPYSFLDFVAAFIAVCLVLAVAITFINAFGRVRGYHLILQAGRMPEVFDAFRDEEDSYDEANSPVVAGVSSGLNI